MPPKSRFLALLRHERRPLQELLRRSSRATSVYSLTRPAMVQILVVRCLNIYISFLCSSCRPLAQCTQRTMRCTFVKFHRQTAPIGPGHNPIDSHLSSSRLSGYSAPTDLLLDPAVLSTAPTFGDPTSSSMYKSPFPLFTSHLSDIPQPDLAKPSEADFAKYQSQAEYIRRLSLF